MDTSPNVFAFAAGWLIGVVAFGGVANLIRVARETLKQSADGSSRGSRFGLMVLASFASSGLWTLVVVLGALIALKSQRWALPLYAGTATWTLFSSLLMIYATRRNVRRAKAGIEPQNSLSDAKFTRRAPTTPTPGPMKVTYAFDLNHDRVNEFKREVKEALAECLLQIESEVVDVINWESKQAFVALYIHRGAPCIAIVGSRRPGAVEWQDVASQLESLLARSGTIVEAHVQFVHDAVHFGRKSAEATKVDVPIDFRAINGGAQPLTVQ